MQEICVRIVLALVVNQIVVSRDTAVTQELMETLALLLKLLIVVLLTKSLIPVKFVQSAQAVIMRHAVLHVSAQLQALVEVLFLFLPLLSHVPQLRLLGGISPVPEEVLVILIPAVKLGSVGIVDLTALQF